MAGVVVTCPECEKKFRPKADVQGKKIKCPFCAHPFVVPAAKAPKPDKEKDKKAKAASAKNGQAKPADAPAKSQAEQDLDDNDVNPYGVKHVELVPRCPNCTEEMENEHATICLHCGYNTMTRQWGKTEKTIGLTFERHLMYLLPAIGSATFSVCAIIFMLYYTIVSPYDVDGTMMSFTNTEAIRMWTTLIMLFVIWVAGMFCFKKFIDKPKPDEIKLD